MYDAFTHQEERRKKKPVSDQNPYLFQDDQNDRAQVIDPLAV
jgi:hypothetical protein